MAKRQSLWRMVFAGVFVFVLICSVLSITVLSGSYTRQLLHEVERRSGVEILPVSSNYSFFSGHLVLTNPELRITPGLTLKASSLSLKVPWYAVITRDFVLSDIHFEAPLFGIDLYILGHKPAMTNLSYFLDQIGYFSFKNGFLDVRDDRRRQPPEEFRLSFHQLTLNLLPEQQTLELNIDGDNQNWELTARYSYQSHSVYGHVLVNDASLEDILQRQFVSCRECQMSGRLHSMLSLVWTREDSLQLRGSGVIDAFHYSDSSGVVFNASAVEFRDYHYISGRAEIEKLIIRSAVNSGFDQESSLKKLLQRSLLNTVNSVEFQKKR